MWTKEQIIDHKKAAKNLIEIKDLAFKHMGKNENISEYEVQQFILGKIREKGMEIDNDPPIVGFNENSATPEFYPNKESKRLKPNTHVLIDLWARLDKKNAPFADITWIGYYGNKIPSEIQKVFDIVVEARNTSLNYIKDNLKRGLLPIGSDVDMASYNLIIKAGYKKERLHDTGHSLGIDDDHGPELNCPTTGCKEKLSKNLGYTIEPGIYLKNKFGVRSEIDFYISEDNEVIVTTDMQESIVKI